MNNLPQDIQTLLEADFGVETNVQIGQEFGLSIGQLANMTDLLSKIFRQEVLLNELEKRLTSELTLDSAATKKLALQICGRRLLVADEWFGGEIAKKIVALGGRTADFQSVVREYQQAIQREKQAVADNESAAAEATNEQQNAVPSFLQDPEAEKRSAKVVFANYLKDILTGGDYQLKIELNVRLITLLLTDEENKVFQRELLDTMLENKEKLTTKKIKLHNENVEPTVGNWLKHFVGFVSIEEVGNAMKKAQYLAEAAAIVDLPKVERLVVENLLKLFIAIKNFYDHLQKYDLADVYIFPFSPAEQEAVQREQSVEKVSGEKPDQAEAVIAPAAAVKKEVDILSLYRDQPADRQKIDAEKEKIVPATRQEYDKVASWLENALRLRKKHLILACLEILATIGALDNLLATDKTFQDLLLGYFKRNNLLTEEKAFRAQPAAAKYIQYFLKFVFLERLGMNENEAARLAVNFSNIFQRRGLAEYGQLAYLDLNDYKFKWTEL